MKLSLKDLRVIIFSIVIFSSLYLVRYPDLANEILIGVLSSTITSILFEHGKFKSAKPTPEEVSKLSSIEHKLDDIKSSLARLESKSK